VLSVAPIAYQRGASFGSTFVLPCVVWERGARLSHPMSVESRRGGISVRPWMSASFGYANADSLGMSWLPLPRFESRAAGVAVYG
jgi:hypothetical protein